MSPLVFAFLENLNIMSSRLFCSTAARLVKTLSVKEAYQQIRIDGKNTSLHHQINTCIFL